MNLLAMFVSLAAQAADTDSSKASEALLGLSVSWLWLVGIIVFFLLITVVPGLFSKPENQ